jgi:hypothetical protein
MSAGHCALSAKPGALFCHPARRPRCCAAVGGSNDDVDVLCERTEPVATLVATGDDARCRRTPERALARCSPRPDAGADAE